MAGKKGWVRDEGGKEHPENSTLLAYNRKQQLEDRLEIRRHTEQCPRCLQLSSELEDASTMLDTLASMQRHLDYADVVSSEQLFNRVQAEAAKDERRVMTRLMRRFEPVQRKSLRYVRYLRPERRISLVSVPAALALALLVTVLAVTIVLAFGVFHARGVPFNLFPHGIAPINQPNSMSVQQQRATPTTSQGNSGSTTTGAGQSAGHIRDCTNGQDRRASQMRICGANFKPGDKVSLLVTLSWSGQPRQRHPVIVNGQGKFEVTIPINHCNVPVAIVAHDLTNSNLYSNTLQGMKFEGCRVPSPNVGGHGGSH